MTFNEWLAAGGFDPEAVAGNEKQKLTLQAAWRAEMAGDQKPKDPQAAATAGTHAVGVTVGGAGASAGGSVSFGRPQVPTSADDGFAATMAAIERENTRRDHIRASTLRWCQANVGETERAKQIRQMCEAAVTDEGMTAQKWETEVLRWDRGAGPHIYSPQKSQLTAEVVEAAVCLSHRLPNVEKAFGERTLEAAHKAFPRGVSLKKLMMLGATANGYRGDDGDYSAVCRAAIGSGLSDNGYGPMAVGPSTGVQVPGILSNIANKYLAASFMNVEQSWRGIAKIRSVNDFKQVTTYRMGGNNTFLRVAPSGEIKHGGLSETSYTNQAKTYGRLLGISREDYINDDLGAFVTVTNELGRGAADGLNNIFWAEWLNDSTFFPTDKSKLNYDDGATDSVLSLAGLDNAESIFAVQTKADGTPLGATPKILLVPPALKNTALTLMKSQDLVVGTTAASGPSANIFAGRYDVVSSAFLPRTSLNDENGVSQTVTGSSTAWYLLCDPMDIPAIEVCFLFGKDTPTVETDQFEFDRLGMATRAFYDFGVAKQEYRAGLKMKGAA